MSDHYSISSDHLLKLIDGISRYSFLLSPDSSRKMTLLEYEEAYFDLITIPCFSFLESLDISKIQSVSDPSRDKSRGPTANSLTLAIH